MPDREKVIQHFEAAIEAGRSDNNWRFVRVDIINDALVLLKEQEPRVLTLEEVLNSPDTMIWVDEIWNDENSAEQYALIENFTYENCYVILRFFDGSSSEESTHYYNEKWRCWSARPTDEQREATPWKE